MTARYLALTGALFCSTAAQADVTAQQVWENWKEQADAFTEGFTFDGETLTGDQLLITGVQVSIDEPELKVLADVGTITLSENGDGSVTIEIPKRYPLTITSAPEYGEVTTFHLDVSQTEMAVIVSGVPDEMIYSVRAESYGIALTDLETTAGQDFTVEEASLILSGIEGAYRIATGDLVETTSELSAGSAEIALHLAGTNDDALVHVNGQIEGLVMTTFWQWPEGLEMREDEFVYDVNMAFRGGYSYEESEYEFSIVGEEGPVDGTASTGTGTLAAAMDFDGVNYDAQVNDVSFNLYMPTELPFPIEASLGEYAIGLGVPLSRGENGPVEARLSFALRDLVIGDAIWAMFDPSEMLPRAPMTLAIALDAEVTPFFDFLDPEQKAAISESEMPGEINSVSITELVISGAGAEITGDGVFTFDNADLQTFPGFPRPEGQANFALNGINELVDTLVNMGLIAADQAMMPRMMLGMFTTPVGEDRLTSIIEVNSQGHVLANGQRLR